MTQNDLVDLFTRNVSASRLEAALGLLRRAGLVAGEREATGGRPRTVWRAA
jgi:hypothetical protein